MRPASIFLIIQLSNSREHFRQVLTFPAGFTSAENIILDFWQKKTGIFSKKVAKQGMI